MPIGALLLLCLLWAAASLRSDLLPATASKTNPSPLLNQACVLALFAVLATATALVRRTAWPRGRTLIQALFAGAGLLALPALLIQFSKSHVDDSTRVAFSPSSQSSQLYSSLISVPNRSRRNAAVLPPPS